MRFKMSLTPNSMKGCALVSTVINSMNPLMMMTDSRAAKEAYKHMSIIPISTVGKDVFLYGLENAKFLNVLREKLEVCGIRAIRRHQSII